MLLKDFIASSRQALSGIYPPQEAAALVERLCTDHLGLRPHAHILEPEMQLEGALLDKANAALGRLCKSEPIQYICGWSEFYGRRFNVNSATLIPRPETEYLCRAAIEAARSYGKAYDELRILDLCTGSGCIAWTLACELPGVVVGSLKATVSMVNGLITKSFIAVTFVAGFVPSVIVIFAL